jgi:hypothetical protein
VRDKGGMLYGLSNNHVTGGSNYAVPGLPILAPGGLDVAAGLRDPETVGHHMAAYPFIDGRPDNVDASKNLDAAIFLLSAPDKISSSQRDFYDTPTSVNPLAVGMKVEKIGRTTGRTKGEVIGELFDFEPVLYILDIINGRKVVFFQSLFAIRGEFAPFSLPGDSGSLITFVDDKDQRHSVGIVVAGNSDGLTLALSLDRVLNHFGVSLVNGHNP